MSTKLPCYSTISKYDSSLPENPIMDPYITVGIPSVFSKVGKLPPVINDIPDEKLQKIRYNSNRYLTMQSYGSK